MCHVIPCCESCRGNIVREIDSMCHVIPCCESCRGNSVREIDSMCHAIPCCEFCRGNIVREIDSMCHVIPCCESCRGNIVREIDSMCHVIPCCESCRGNIVREIDSMCHVIPCCESCRDPSCRDDPEFQMNDKSCYELVKDSTNVCYTERVRSACCATCFTANSGVLGCEFGDKVKGKCTTINDCKKYDATTYLHKDPSSIDKQTVNLLDSTAGVTVNINLSSDDVNDLPQNLEANFQLNDNTTLSLHLQRVSHFYQDIPVYIAKKDSNGIINRHRQTVDSDKTVGFYQDVIRQGNIKLTRESDGQLIIEGDFKQGGHKYSISPSHKVKRETGPHQQLYNIQLKNEQIQKSRTKDFIKTLGRPFSTDIAPELPLLRHNARYSRDVKPTYYVDVAATVDKKLYDIFVERHRSESNVSLHILEYFAFIFNGIDLCYKGITWATYNINVRLVKVVIFTDISVYQVTMANDSSKSVDAEVSLENFEKLLNTTAGFELFAPYDHAMLFIGSAMKTPDTDLLGLAYLGQVCQDDGSSVSIIVELGSYTTVLTAAHELGHSIAAEHDGDKNTCTSDDRYVMAVSDSTETPGTELHPWIFSNCSVYNFTVLITKLLQTSRGRMCLTGIIPIDPAIPDTSDRYLGQIYPPDKQCELRHDTRYYFSRLNSGQSLCTQLICANKDDSTDIKIDVAYYGTTCGSGKLCKQGSCVPDPAAPLVNDNCMFGDYNQSCQDSVKAFNGYCYADVSFHVCCASCLSVFKTVHGCEYGDRVSGCTSSVCNSSNMTAIQECCGTCSYGSTYTTAATTTAQTVTTTKRTTASTSASSCRDDTGFMMNEMTCSLLVWSSANICYNQTVRSSCCHTCSLSNTGIAGCEFGDKVINKCLMVEDCKAYNSDCCESCRGIIGLASLTRSSLVLILALVTL
ncbi:hypothetical protein Btru_059755, partial [Bulinus truncatus]